jgi:hypothetical protein
MLASTIREMSVSEKSACLAAAYFETMIQIWDLQSRTMINEFPTIFCSGARNLAIAPGANVLVTGLSEGQGQGKVAAYEVPSGRLLWEHRGLTYPTRLRFSESGEYIWCSIGRRSSRAVKRLRVTDGFVLQVIEATKECVEGQYGRDLIVFGDNEQGTFSLVGGGAEFQIPRTTFALLDASFAPDCVCLTESGGPVRCINYSDGTESWRFDPGEDSHVLALHYSSKRALFYGVLRHLKKGGNRSVLDYNPITGQQMRICDLDFSSWEQVFLTGVDHLVGSSGEIIDLSNGTILAKLDFPLKEYPDD